MKSIILIFILLIIKSSQAWLRLNYSLCDCSLPNFKNKTHRLKRVIEGDEIKPEEFKFFASIYIKYLIGHSSSKYQFSHIATGSVIGDSWIVTAGHVFYTDLKVYMESKDFEVGVAAGKDHDLRNMYGDPKHTREIENVFTDGKLTGGRNDKNVLDGGEPLPKILIYAHDAILLQLKRPFELGESTNVYTACIYGDFKYPNIKKSLKFITGGWNSVSLIFEKDEKGELKFKKQLNELFDGPPLLYGMLLRGELNDFEDCKKYEMLCTQKVEDIKPECKPGQLECKEKIENMTANICLGDRGGPVLWVNDDRKLGPKGIMLVAVNSQMFQKPPADIIAVDERICDSKKIDYHALTSFIYPQIENKIYHCNAPLEKSP